jgi:hypothetical protein
LRDFIFARPPQPSDPAVFAQYITGASRRQKEPSLKRKAAGRILHLAGWYGGIMGSIRNWMLGAAVVAGAAALGAAPAQAAEFGIYARGPVAYVPPCPGAGYVWVAGYRANGYWVPGRWNFAGVRGPAYAGHFDRFRGREFDRRFDDHGRFRR